MDWNKSSEKIFGYTKQEAIGKSANFIVAENFKVVLDEYWNNIKSGNVLGEQKVYENLTKSGELIKVNWFSTSLYDTNGKFIGIGCLVENITEQSKNEAEINRQLQEKEILLSEVHHRVKNNLAIISGLLFMQAESVNDIKVKQLLTESQSRIKSMAIIHDQLYKNENFSEIDIQNYLKELTLKIASTYSIPTKKIDIDIESNNFYLPISQALTIGLIINELVTNSYKYAFPVHSNGKIKIRFNKNENYFFSVKDNGVGYPTSEKLDEVSSLGINLIKILAQQLKGEVKFLSENGALCELRF